MAQNITLLGANYSAVPAVTLPKTGGGTARFDDCTVVTASASDVASGKIFVASNGTITTGTASGGASNLVRGEFKTNSTSGVQTVTIPYTGSGYPLVCVICIKGGAYVSGTDWYTSTDRYAIGMWSMSKSVMSSSPTYTTSGTQNQGVVASIYKNSTSDSTTYSRSSSMNTNTYSSNDPNAQATSAVRFKGNSKTIAIYVKSTSYGFLPNQDYEYFVVYSS